MIIKSCNEKILAFFSPGLLLRGKQLSARIFSDEPAVLCDTLRRRSHKVADCCGPTFFTDAWVAVVLEAGLPAEERTKRWPAVFTKKYLKPDYVNKGRAAKAFSSVRNQWVYRVACNKYQLCGTEGATNGIAKEIVIGNGKISSKADLAEGNPCHVQDNDYVYPEKSSMPPPAQPAQTSLERRKRKPTDVLESLRDIKKVHPSLSHIISTENEEKEERLSDKKTSSTTPEVRGLIKVLADKYGSEEEEVQPSRKVNQKKEDWELRLENAELRGKLRRAEMKFLRLADAMESVHSVIDPLQRRLLTAHLC